MPSLRRLGLTAAGLLAAGLLLSPAPAGGAVVNDVTRLNPVVVDRVLAPTTLDEIVAAVRSHPGPIAIGGGRFSQGGQTATERALQIDMRRFNQVIAFSPERREITVQTGITWRRLQEFLDPHDMSVQIMQSYANFTVGGSLSVNVHGRYVGLGPLVLSVRRIRMVLADGTLATASPTENADLFYGAIGGYGGLGVIVEATLALADNVRVERRSVVMPLHDYRAYFDGQVRNDGGVVFHNADIYPGGYDTVRATSWVRTEKPVTVEDRLVPADASYWLDRVVMHLIADWPGGKRLRRAVVDPLLFRSERVEWRNYEASFDVKELEPVSRRSSTYVLQEYFVPVDRLEEFVRAMGTILNRRRVNVINVSIRHAHQDPGTLLAWARSEVFAFVLYYKQGTGPEDRAAVGVWTRELIDAAIAEGGAYYLPYQIHATAEQFRAAYPRADEFFALKRRLDPTGKFRNKLWDAYDPAPAGSPPAVASPPVRIFPPDPPVDPAAEARLAASLKDVAGYRRDEAQTYLTLPEWLLVFYPAEYAESLERRPASAFPYFGSIRQFWAYDRDVNRVIRGKYPFNWGYQVMVVVIGASYTIENVVKGAYENSFGRLSEWIAGGAMTQEDRFAADVAQEYVDFIRVEPWYEFSFLRSLKQLWAETDLFGPHLLRKWERKAVLSAEYLVKAQYGMLIKLASKAAYGTETTTILAVAWPPATGAIEPVAGVEVRQRFEDGRALLALPRYDAFKDAVIPLVGQGVRFSEIAGNADILMTAIVPAAWSWDLSAGSVLFERPMLTDPGRKRIAVRVPVRELHRVLLEMGDQARAIEHLYDY